MESQKKIKRAYELDDWQKEILAYDGDICCCTGRQIGKSQIIAEKAAEWAVNNPKNRIMIISATEDQAMLMLVKIMIYLNDNYVHLISRKKEEKPTKHRVILKNKSTIITKAVGQSGIGIRGDTIDVLIGDEAGYIPDEVWDAATPMLMTKDARMWLLSTPNVKKGFFYEAFTNRDLGFKTWHKTSPEVAEARLEPIRSRMLKNIEKARARLSDLAYAQQYLGQFLEQKNQLFSDELIKSCQTVQRSPDFLVASSCSSAPAGQYYLGMDVARMGGDEITYEVFEHKGRKLIQRASIVRKFDKLSLTTDKVIELDRFFNFKKIFIDDANFGAGVCDELERNNKIKRKLVRINNARKSIDRDSNRTRRIFKEDLYVNLLKLMELGRIQLLTDPNITASLQSIVRETSEKTGETRIWGRYSHIAEGIIRAAWGYRGKHLKLFCDYI